MLVRDYHIPGSASNLIRISNRADVFVESPNEAQPDIQPPSLLVWRGALFDPAIERAMTKASWPLEILAAFPKMSGWNWEAQRAGSAERLTQWPEILDVVSKACGATAQPSGNLTLTLQLRSYEEKDWQVGGYSWWLEQRNRFVVSESWVDTFFDRLLKMLGAVQSIQLDFYVEQISIILAKDPNDLLSTLTPTMHSDMYYGSRETALCSLAETGFSRYEGTLFAPTIRMDALEPHRPIDLDKMWQILGDAPVIEARSGDVILYDGMIGPDGVAHAKNGVPHISSDQPGQSSRLLILMRNRKQVMSAAASNDRLVA